MKNLIMIIPLLAFFVAQPAFAQWGMKWDAALKANESWLKEYREAEGAAAKERVYEDLRVDYPMNNDGRREIAYDYLHSDLAAKWLSKGNKEKHDSYKARVNDRRMLYGFVSSVLDPWIEARENLELTANVAEQYLSELVRARSSKESGYSFRAHGIFLEDFVRVESMRMNYEQALKQIRHADESMLLMLLGSPEFLDAYVDVMVKTGNHQALLDLMAAAIENGQKNEKVTDALKTAYNKVHGDKSGYQSYLSSLENVAYQHVYEEMTGKRIKKPQPAPAFTLKNLKGESVSLEELRGSVVVIDFWATWCNPCKASFPGMQLAVNEYKDDPDVRFLFIDTWEERMNHTDTKAVVKQFIEKKGYTFEVFLDSEGKVVSDFGVRGLPTKFVIDREGMIQFKSVGFNGKTANLVNEMKAMIELAKSDR